MTNFRGLPVPPTEADELASFAGDPDFMLSLARGMLIFRAFAEKRERLTVAQVAAVTGLPRSTASRCLYTLTKLGYLANEGSKYLPRASTLMLASAYFTRVHWEAAVQPLIDDLRDRFGITFALGSYEDGAIYYVVVSRYVGSVTLVASVGRRLPAYCTSVGRIFLAELPPAELGAYLDELTPFPFTAHTAVDRATLEGRVEEVRLHGYAIANQEVDIGIRAIAVPVRPEGRGVVAALMAGAEISELPDERVRGEILPSLQKAANEIAMLWQNF